MIHGRLQFLWQAPAIKLFHGCCTEEDTANTAINMQTSMQMHLSSVLHTTYSPRTKRSCAWQKHVKGIRSWWHCVKLTSNSNLCLLRVGVHHVRCTVWFSSSNSWWTCSQLLHCWPRQEDARGAVSADCLTGKLISHIDYFTVPCLDSLERETVPTAVINWIPVNKFTVLVFDAFRSRLQTIWPI